MFKMKAKNLNSLNTSFSIENDYLKFGNSLLVQTEALEKLQSELRKLEFRRKLLNQKS